MMRHPQSQTLPHQIDPWAYARRREYQTGELLLEHTQSLRQWSTDETRAITAHIEGTIDAHHQPHISGKVSVDLDVECQRCLQPMQIAIEKSFDYVLIRHQSYEERIEGPYEGLICSDDILDVTWFLEEEILLAMPMIAKHEKCNPPAMAADTQTQPSEIEPSNPFAALKHLLNDKEH